MKEQFLTAAVIFKKQNKKLHTQTSSKIRGQLVLDQMSSLSQQTDVVDLLIRVNLAILLLNSPTHGLCTCEDEGLFSPGTFLKC